MDYYLSFHFLGVRSFRGWLPSQVQLSQIKRSCLLSSLYSWLSKHTQYKLINARLTNRWIPHVQTEINSMYRRCMCLLPTHTHTHTCTHAAAKLTGRIQCSRKEAKGRNLTGPTAE